MISQLKRKFSLPGDFNTYQSVILGVPAAPPIVNLILLLTKQYIVSTKLCYDDTGSVPRMSHLLNVITKHAEAENIISKKQNNMELFHKKWERLIDEGGSVTSWLTAEEVGTLARGSARSVGGGAGAADIAL